MREVKTICPYCGVGCGILAASDGETIRGVRGDPSHPANFGRLCSKGATVHQTVHVRSRSRRAMIRDRRQDPRRAVAPPDAVRHIAERLERIMGEHGPGAVGFYISGQLSTESQYVFNKLAKGCLRTNHIDSNSRLCMSSAAAGMTLSLGSDGPPTCYADIEQADTFLFIGSNAAQTHPVTFSRVRDRLRAGARMIVVDPRRTMTAEGANIFLAARPGTDLVLLNGLLHLLDSWGALDRSFIDRHTEGFDELSAMLAAYPPRRVSGICGIPAQQLVETARMIQSARGLITFWTMGVNQTVTGTFTSNAIINLHLALGQIGRPGCGPFSLTGQPNAMGGRDVGYMAHLLPGQRQVANPLHRHQMEQVWGLPAGAISAEPGLDAVRLFEAVESGDIKAIWITATNPAASMPNLPRIRAALERAQMVILQDAYSPTETEPFADILLPGAVNLEQAGTFCNSERRVSLMEQVVPPPGDAKPDWWWPRQVGVAMGHGELLRFDSAEGVFDEFARSTAGRPNDQSALTHALLRAKGPQFWPYPALGKPSERRYADALFPTPTGKARFLARAYLDEGERPTEKFPMILTTGRLPNQWHTRTKTALVPALAALDSEPFLHMNPADAADLRLADGQAVVITSPRGKAKSKLKFDADICPGVVFMSIHFNELFAQAASCNEVTSDETDAISRQPALKGCAVSVAAVGAATSPKRTEEPERATDSRSPLAWGSDVENRRVSRT